MKVKMGQYCTGWPILHGRVFLVPCKRWLVQCTRVYCTVAYTRQLTFYKVPEKNRTIFIWSGCIWQSWLVVRCEIGSARPLHENSSWGQLKGGGAHGHKGEATPPPLASNPGVWGILTTHTHYILIRFFMHALTMLIFFSQKFRILFSEINK